ncbi:MAG: MaoC family dehydratase [Gammaproteobacteria bacterium]|nr:MaoC family dehydratase [Gammaproteobacteria bacterium]
MKKHDILYYWEDLQPGLKFEMGPKVFSLDEILEFANKYDPQPFHIDVEGAKNSIYGGIIASGWHTCAVLFRLLCDGFILNSASVGSPGMESIRWIKPVYPGDSLTLTVEVMQTKEMKSNPSLGMALTRWEAKNQHDALVMTLEGWGMYRKRSSV